MLGCALLFMINMPCRSMGLIVLILCNIIAISYGQIDLNSTSTNVNIGETDLKLLASDATVKVSDVTTVSSDVTIKVSDVATVSSDVTIKVSDVATVSSDVTIKVSDVTAVPSDYSDDGTGGAETSTYKSVPKLIISDNEKHFTSTYASVSEPEFKVIVSDTGDPKLEETDLSMDKNNKPKCPQDNTKPCVVKCCPLGESLGPNRVCEPSDLKFAVQFFNQSAPSFTASEDVYNMIYGDPCPYGKYRLEPRVDSNDEFHILRNGSIRAPYLFPYPLQSDEYCLEVFKDPDMEEEDVLPLVCFKEPPPKTRLTVQYILYPIGLLISVPFLIVTMLVYTLIPKLRDLHGKCLSCHVVCLAVAYIFLATVQLIGESMNQEMCVGVGSEQNTGVKKICMSVVTFVIQFSFVACFFWLNVLCFDTWWNVKANVRFCGNGRQPNKYMCYEKINDGVDMTESMKRKVFICYSVYAWCLPVLFVIVSMVMDLMPTIPSSYLKPNFGQNKCWFNSEEAELQYFYGPVGFLICVNVVLFLLTAWRIFSHEWKSGDGRTPRQTFRMCLTLFGVMGINWVMEVISWMAGGPEYIWYFTDVINTLQGVIIFCIFVLEPRIRDIVRVELWPKVSEILCKCRRTTLYSSPKDAANGTVNGSV